MKYLAALFGLWVGNCIFQLYGAETPDYIEAMKITYLQAVAVLVVWLLD